MLSTLRQYLRQRRSGEPIIVVSGLPRSGTSMAMKMLDAAGIPLVTDEVRLPDEDNPRGYFELESVKALGEQDDKSWLAEAGGKAIKIISHLLRELPDHHAYKVIFMNRHIQEVIRSQNKMLIRRGEELSGDDQNVTALLEQHLRLIQPWLRKQQNFSVLDLHYSEVVSAPLQGAVQMADFLERELEHEKMASVVDPGLYRNRAD